MPRQTYPAYRQRPDKNLAVVTLTDAATGHRRDYYLGRYDTPESREAYHRLLASWDKLGHRLPPAPNEEAPRPESITVAEVMAAYWQWAQSYYRPSECDGLRAVLRLLRQYFGSVPAVAFGSVRLRELREAMITGDPAAKPPRQAGSRRYINAQVRRIQRMFRWAASREMIPVSVHQQLATIEPLTGQTGGPQPLTPERPPMRSCQGCGGAKYYPQDFNRPGGSDELIRQLQ